MASLVEYTEYNVAIPEFHIGFIRDALGSRDLSGLTNGRIEAINVSGEHPLVQLTGAALSAMSAGATPDIAGILPAISVVEADEEEEATTLGQGLKNYEIIDSNYVTTLRQSFPDMESRIQEGLITDAQLDRIENALNNIEGNQLLAEVHGYYERTSVIISLWTTGLQERQILGRLLRSIAYKLRLAMIQRHLKDITIRTSKGLVNFNFGQVLFGQETEIRFLNYFRNVSVLDEKPIDYTLPVYTIGGYTPIDRPDDPAVPSYDDDPQ